MEQKPKNPCRINCGNGKRSPRPHCSCRHTAEPVDIKVGSESVNSCVMKEKRGKQNEVGQSGPNERRRLDAVIVLSVVSGGVGASRLSSNSWQQMLQSRAVLGRGGRLPNKKNQADLEQVGSLFFFIFHFTWPVGGRGRPNDSSMPLLFSTTDGRRGLKCNFEEKYKTCIIVALPPPLHQRFQMPIGCAPRLNHICRPCPFTVTCSEQTPCDKQVEREPRV